MSCRYDPEMWTLLDAKGQVLFVLNLQINVDSLFWYARQVLWV